LCGQDGKWFEVHQKRNEKGQQPLDLYFPNKTYLSFCEVLLPGRLRVDYKEEYSSMKKRSETG
jgi:hypothetical protein